MILYTIGFWIILWTNIVEEKNILKQPLIDNNGSSASLSDLAFASLTCTISRNLSVTKPSFVSPKLFHMHKPQQESFES
jgi:hypothetical protein